MVYQQVSEITEEGGNYVIVAPDKEGNLIPFGKLQDESKNYGYMAGEAVTVTNGFITSDVTDYVIAVAPSSVGYTLQRPDGNSFISRVPIIVSIWVLRFLIMLLPIGCSSLFKTECLRWLTTKQEDREVELL